MGLSHNSDLSKIGYAWLLCKNCGFEDNNTNDAVPVKGAQKFAGPDNDRPNCKAEKCRTCKLAEQYIFTIQYTM